MEEIVENGENSSDDNSYNSSYNNGYNASALPSPLPAINLPSGGGAMRGIDEKFSVNAANGTATRTIPLPLSPGRSGFAPQLSISYDSGAGNQAFGLGWHIDLPNITRKTDKGLPRYDDAHESDVFILSGAEDLVPVLSEDGQPYGEQRSLEGTLFQVQRYRPRTEGPFARIERWTNTQTEEVHWRSISAENLTTVYGRQPESRIADPGNPRRVFRWLICESYDDQGNAIVYRYKAEDEASLDLTALHEQHRSVAARRANRYLKRILYGNRTPHQPSEDLHQRSDWSFKALFDYGEAHYQAQAEDGDGQVFVTASNTEQTPWPVRQDPTSTYRAGFEQRTYRLCRRVLMFHHLPEELGADDYLVSALHLCYRESAVNTLLTGVVQAAYERQADGRFLQQSLPPLNYDYSEAVIQSEVRAVDNDSLAHLPAGLSDGAYQWVDLDGEGVSGLLTQQGGGLFYTPNRGEGQLGSQVKLPSQPSQAALNGAQKLVDLDGDGQLELVTLERPAPGFYPRKENNDWSPPRAFVSLPSLDWRDPNLRLLDLTGDGRADVLLTEQRAFTWYPSLGIDGYGRGRRISLGDNDETCPRLVFADHSQSIYLADMSGDGLTDLVRIRNGEICYWPNLGYGHFGARVAMDKAPRFDTLDHFDQQRIRLADTDGSGVADILYIQPDQRVAVYLNRAGNSWAGAQWIEHVPALDNLADLTVVDLLGNGTACLVWSSPLPGNRRRPLRYIDLMGGQKPYLLVAARNNQGVESRIHYCASTRFYLQDKAAGRPWVTRLPFPVQVVERVEVFDAVSRNRFSTRYAYHHGYFDGAEQEFRGFALVEQWDTETLAALTADGELPMAVNIEASSHTPPVYRKTWFHTGVYLGRRRVSNLFADLLSERDTGAYYREPGLSRAQAAALLLPDSILPEGLSLDEEREACRALKGAVLREEIYALDGSEREAHPYSVSEQSYTIRRVQPKAGNRHAVFFTHLSEALETHYERNPVDPRLSHSLTLAVDAFGNVLQSLTIGYGRRNPDPLLSPADQQRQAQWVITASDNRYTQPVEQEHHYRTPLPSETSTYELTGLALAPDQVRFDMAQLVSAWEAAVPIDYHQAPAGGLQKRLLSQTRTHYRANDFGESQLDPQALLPLGVVESLALPGESYTLAFTSAHLHQVFGDRFDETMLLETMLLETMLLDEGRYVQLEDSEHWWIPSGRVFFSPEESDSAAAERTYAQQHFFQPQRAHDPFGHIHRVRYDAYDLLQVETEDALGNRITAGERADNGDIVPRLNYRVLQPALVTDPNGNRSAVAFDVFGRVVVTAAMGKATETLGDYLDGVETQLSRAQIEAFLADPRGPVAAELLGTATTRIIYDQQRFLYGDQPAVAATIARETHISDLGDGEVAALQVSLAYTDGFGRTIQSKVQAEPDMTAAPRWVSSGWTVFNNKGQAVKQYEPFFSADHQFEFGVAVGVSPTLCYDPMGRVVATLHPNHSWEKVRFDAWRQESWDVNDTVLLDNPAADADVGGYFQRLEAGSYLPTWHQARSGGELGQAQQDAANKTAAHAVTPGVTYVDSQGRPFLSLADNGAGEHHATRTELTIDGKALRIIDDRGNVVMAYQVEVDGNPPVPGYDMAGRQLYQNSMDAGERNVLPDIAAKPLYRWDHRGYRRRSTYDELQRPTYLFVQPEAQPERLVEVTVYGESHQDAATLNLKGRIYRIYDGAGVATNRRYDFKGNLQESERQLAQQYRTVIDWSVLSGVTSVADIEASAELLLENRIFSSNTEYDALNRVLSTTAPDGSTALPTYNAAALLEQLSVRLQGAAQATGFVDAIDYDARGQRQRISYHSADGANVVTQYHYDPDTFRLIRLHTVRAQDNADLQDLHYAYDPAGNITSIRDDAQQTVFFNNTEIAPHNHYTYDARYRLISAEGREHAAQNNVQREADALTASVGVPFANSPQALQRYREDYSYDSVGNMLSMAHRGGDIQRWTRRYLYADNSNRLLATSLPGDGDEQFSSAYTYDPHGNMVSMPHLPFMQWDSHDRLQASSRQVVNSGTPETTYYVYSAGGERVRKVTERQADEGQTATRLNERIYLGGFEIYREYGSDGDSVEFERETLHVMDDQQRIALVDTRTQGNDASALQSLRYQLGNHLGSASLELDEQAAVISYEEYHPYGSSAYQAGRAVAEVSLKRYRYTGMERDEETGLNYHGARYYATWLGRWTAVDPRELIDGVNDYSYTLNNPIIFRDPAGEYAKPPPGDEDRVLRRLEDVEAEIEKTDDAGELEKLFHLENQLIDLLPEPASAEEEEVPTEETQSYGDGEYDAADTLHPELFRPFNLDEEAKPIISGAEILGWTQDKPGTGGDIIETYDVDGNLMDEKINGLQEPDVDPYSFLPGGGGPGAKMARGAGRGLIKKTWSALKSLFARKSRKKAAGKVVVNEVKEKTPQMLVEEEMQRILKTNPELSKKEAYEMAKQFVKSNRQLREVRHIETPGNTGMGSRPPGSRGSSRSHKYKKGR